MLTYDICIYEYDDVLLIGMYLLWRMLCSSCYIFTVLPCGAPNREPHRRWNPYEMFKCILSQMYRLTRQITSSAAWPSHLNLNIWKTGLHAWGFWFLLICFPILLWLLWFDSFYLFSVKSVKRFFFNDYLQLPEAHIHFYFSFYIFSNSLTCHVGSRRGSSIFLVIVFLK